MEVLFYDLRDETGSVVLGGSSGSAFLGWVGGVVLPQREFSTLVPLVVDDLQTWGGSFTEGPTQGERVLGSLEVGDLSTTSLSVSTVEGVVSTLDVG